MHLSLQSAGGLDLPLGPFADCVQESVAKWTLDVVMFFHTKHVSQSDTPSKGIHEGLTQMCLSYNPIQCILYFKDVHKPVVSLARCCKMGTLINLILFWWVLTGSCLRICGLKCTEMLFHKRSLLSFFMLTERPQ